MDCIRVFMSLIFVSYVAGMAIDDIFRQAEQKYEEEIQSSEGSRAAQPDWDSYSLPGRNEELVKIQYDMLISKDTWENDFQRSSKRAGGRKKRNAVPDKDLLWNSRLIPYKISDEFSPADQLVILKAMQMWSQFTCLSFVPAKDADYDMLIFQKEPWDSVCVSHVGRMKGAQPIILGSLCIHINTIVHEIGHALGLYHEHMRSDRDTHVTINYENVNETDHKQFDKLKNTEENTYNQPYDYYSIMHYGKSAFRLEDGLITIEPKDASYLDIIGKSNTLSFIDVQKANAMYSCSAGCVPKKCPKDAFLGKNCDCYCHGDDQLSVFKCDLESFCGPPEIDMNLFHVYTPGENLRELKRVMGKKYPEGTALLVVFKDPRCVPTEATIMCVDTQWSGDIPDCQKAGCAIDENWYYRYLFDESLLIHDVLIPSGTKMPIQCMNAEDRKLDLVCTDNAEWDNEDSLPKCYDGEDCEIIDHAAQNVDLYIGHQILNVGETVTPGTKVVAVCGGIKNSDMEEGKTFTQLTCKDGLLEGKIPDSCKKELYQCPMVLHSTTRGPADKRFIITCLDGYEMSGGDENQNAGTRQFECDASGTWTPFTPTCIPAGCMVNFDNTHGSVIWRNGDEIESETKVVSETDVMVMCEKGYYPDEMVFTCSKGKFSSAEESGLTNCRHVICPVPALPDTLIYRPKVDSYVYKDEISMRRCVGNLEFRGDPRITCQKDGTWSGIATCTEFCDGAAEYTHKYQNVQFKSTGKKADGATYTKCEEKCKTYQRWLCKSFMFGYDEGYPVCRIYYKNPDKDPSSFLEPKSYWTVGVRRCAE